LNFSKNNKNETSFLQQNNKNETPLSSTKYEKGTPLFPKLIFQVLKRGVQVLNKTNKSVFHFFFSFNP